MNVWAVINTGVRICILLLNSVLNRGMNIFPFYYGWKCSAFSNSLSYREHFYHTFSIIHRINGISDTSPRIFFLFWETKSFTLLLVIFNLLKNYAGDFLVMISSANKLESLSKFKMVYSVFQLRLIHLGVIYKSELLYSTKEELLGNFRARNFIDVPWWFRITIRWNDKMYSTKHKMTFRCSNLPTRIKAAYLSGPIQHYIHNLPTLF